MIQASIVIPVSSTLWKVASPTNWPKVLSDIPAVPFVNAFDNLFNLNDTFMADINERHKQCGFADYIDKHYTFPPAAGGMGVPPKSKMRRGCSLWNDVLNAVMKVNPCFDYYDISTTC
jgi:carboxypeptidase D